MDSLPVFPRNAVHTGTEARLTSEFEMGSGEPRPYGRPNTIFSYLFINITTAKFQVRIKLIRTISE